MKIKALNYLLTIAITGFLFFSCNSDSTQKTENKTQEEEMPSPAVSDTAICYTFDNGKDKITMQITNSNNTVTGDLAYNYFEKDKNAGTIKGEMHGDTLLALYTFMSEGKESKREVAFLKKDDKIIEGYGTVNPTSGEPDLTDRSSIKFDNTFALQKTDCK